MNRTIPQDRPHDLQVELFLATREEKGCSALTIRNYRLALYRFRDFYPHPMPEVKPDNVILYLASLRKAGMTAANRSWHQRHLFPWLRWLYGRGDIERDPLRGVDSVSVPRVYHLQVMEPEMADLMATLGKANSWMAYRDIAILRLLWSTGLRRGELASLDLKDVDFQSQVILVMGKGQKARRTPFDRPAKMALLEYLQRERGQMEGPLFVSRDGGRMTGESLRLLMRRLSERSGVKVHCHAFRRGFARRMRRGGLDIGETAALMGHSQLTMTIRYSQVGEEEAAIDSYRRLTG